jgi:hypothetical protein
MHGMDANLAGRNAGGFGKLRARAKRTFGRSPGIYRSIVIYFNQK